MLDKLAIIAMVIAALLISVDRICGCVEVQKRLLWSAVLLSLTQVEFEEDLGHVVA